jgi:hypothetical protein
MAEGWVCPECGLDYDTVSPSDAVVAARSFGRRFADLVRSVDDSQILRRKPEPKVWSVLEYAAHVRDVFDWMANVVDRMRTENSPTIGFPDQDQLAEQRHYNEQDPADVVGELKTNAEKLAQAIERVRPADLDRTAHFSWGERDLLTMIRNAVHEGKHHLRDAERVLEQVSSS